MSHQLFFDLFRKYDGYKDNSLKLKRPSQLQEVLDIARKLLCEFTDPTQDTLPTKETRVKLLQLKGVLEMYGHFSGINRKVQIKYQPYGKPKSSSSEENEDSLDGEKKPSLLLILKWGGELTADGKVQAEDLGTAFRKIYPCAEGIQEGFLRLHSTYRHDLKIYASDEGRVQMTAAAFAKGLLALDGELAPILVQMVKSANTNGLLDNDSMSAKWQNEVKTKLRDCLTEDKTLTDDDINKIDPTNNFSIRSALDFIKNPVEMCKKVYSYLHELVNLIRSKIMDNKYYDLKLYHDESWELLLRRWSKLEKDFYNKKVRFFGFGQLTRHFQNNLSFFRIMIETKVRNKQDSGHLRLDQVRSHAQPQHSQLPERLQPVQLLQGTRRRSHSPGVRHERRRKAQDRTGHSHALAEENPRRHQMQPHRHLELRGSVR